MYFTPLRLFPLYTVAKLLFLDVPKDNVCIKGFVTSVQKFGKFFFLKVNDGSTLTEIQVVLPKKLYSIGAINVGTTVNVSGNWVKSVGSAQPMEFFADKFSIIGYNELKPLVSENNVLRQKFHLRAKNPAFSSILKLRSHLYVASHKFFSKKKFTFVDTPMISQNDCEGAGEIFTIKSFADDDFFDEKNIFLPVSAQLHLEAISCAIPNVYTIGPVFRADKSGTRQHLAEFRMLEVECAFVDDINDICQIVEDYVKFVAVEVAKFAEDLKISSVLCNRTNTVLNCLLTGKLIPRIFYFDAIELLQKKGETNITKLSKKHELMLVEIFNGPVFVLNYPAKTKPFYMKCSADGHTVKNFDLLAPFVGELAGGSVREDNYEVLESRLTNNDAKVGLNWYLELRKSGYPRSSGFGLGFDRLVQSLFGVENIRDSLPFPRWYLLVEFLYNFKENTTVSDSDVYHAVMDKVGLLHGDYGVATIRTSFQVKIYDDSTNVAVFRISVAGRHILCSTLPFVICVGTSPCSLRIIFEASSMRAIERRLIKSNLEQLYARLKVVNTQAEKAEIQQAICSVTGFSVAHIRM